MRLTDKTEKFDLGLVNEILEGKRLEKYVPLIGWITHYQRDWLRDDLVSGVVVGAIMVPVAMAYAQMAGVPPVLAPTYRCLRRWRSRWA